MRKNSCLFEKRLVGCQKLANYEIDRGEEPEATKLTKETKQSFENLYDGCLGRNRSREILKSQGWTFANLHHSRLGVRSALIFAKFYHMGVGTNSQKIGKGAVGAPSPFVASVVEFRKNQRATN